MISRRFVCGFTPCVDRARISREEIARETGSAAHEPAPARALDGRGGSVELLLELVEGAKSLRDGGLEGAILEGAAVALLLGGRGREVEPEEGVVDVATAVELEGGLEGDALLGGGGLCVGLLCGVEGGDIGLVVLLVVELHDLAGDEGLECVVRVREVGEGVLAGHGGGGEQRGGLRETEEAADSARYLSHVIGC